MYRRWQFFRHSGNKGLRISVSLVIRVVIFCAYRVVVAMYVHLAPILLTFIVLLPWSSKTSEYFVGHNFDPPSSAYGVVIVQRAMVLNRPHFGDNLTDFPTLDFVPVWTDMLQAASAFSPSSFCGACSCILAVSIVAPLVAFLVFGANKVSVVSTRPYSVLELLSQEYIDALMFWRKRLPLIPISSHANIEISHDNIVSNPGVLDITRDEQIREEEAAQ